LQDAINKAKAGSKSGIVEVVNDAEFIKMYPFIKEMDFLSPQEKLVLILTEEEYPLAEIALYTGASEATVRAVKSRIRSKLMQSGSISAQNNKLKIFKKKTL
jgi:DNA-binding NarL/FixJ family response regulator